jgi:hypothetical protein
MTDTLKGKAVKALKTEEKSAEKFRKEVTTSLEQLEHPGEKSQKAPGAGAKVAGAKVAGHGAESKSKKK